MSSSSAVELLAMREGGDVASEFLNLAAGEGDAEVLAGDVFDLMGFVEDDGAVIGNDGAAVVALHRHVRKE